MKGAGDGSNRDATPSYIAFGRSGNAAPGAGGGSGPDPGTPVPTPPIPTQPLPPTPGADGGPITDVNSLPVVSPAVAMKIKVAAGFGAVGGPPLAADVAAALVPAAHKPRTERCPLKPLQPPARPKTGH